MKNFTYQYDVVETVYDNHGCVLWTAYDESQKDKDGFDLEVLILDTPNNERRIYDDSETNREICMDIIEVWLQNNL